MYSAAAHAHATLIHVKSEEERKVKAFEIIHSFDRIHSIWSDLDYYKTSGRLPEKPVEKPPLILEDLSVLDLITRRNTLRSYISKEKKAGNDIDKIAAWKTEIEKISELIHGKQTQV